MAALKHQQPAGLAHLPEPDLAQLVDLPHPLLNRNLELANNRKQPAHPLQHLDLAGLAAHPLLLDLAVHPLPNRWKDSANTRSSGSATLARLPKAAAFSVEALPGGGLGGLAHLP